MKQILAVVIVVLSATSAGLAAAQTKTARSGSYEGLSDADRRVVSAIYESQLGSRRDLAGHPLLSKDQITAMRLGSTWERVFERLSKQGSVMFHTLSQALASYSRDTASTSRPLIISTAAGEQIVVPRRAVPSQSSPPSNPALANIIPTPPVRRAHIKTVELPVLAAGASDIRSEATGEPKPGGLITPVNAAPVAQNR